MRLRVWYVPVLIVGIVALHFAALYIGEYDRQIEAGFVWWDNVLHALVGATFALAWLWLLQYLGRSTSSRAAIISTLLFVLFIAVAWELAEYFLRLFYRSLAIGLKLYSPNLAEATSDIISNVVGAASVLALIVVKGGKQKYAFVDRDGTIIWEPPRPADADPRETIELKSADQVSFTEGAIDGLKKLLDKGYKLVLCTNQSYLGTPRHPRDIFDQVMKRMHDGLEPHGIRFQFEMVCPHGPDQGCDCRKPKIGGLKKFLATHDVDLANSLMFGDRDTDGEFAKNLGVRFVRVETNKRFELPVAL